MKRLFVTMFSVVVLSFSAVAQTTTSAATSTVSTLSTAQITTPALSTPVLSTSSQSQEKISNGPRVWNFENADIKTVISAVSKETGKNFIVDPRVQGKVTLISNTPMDKDEVYGVFLTLLQTYGYLVIPNGSDMYKIVPDSIAKYQNIPAYTKPGEAAVTGSAVMVKVIPVRNGNAEQFVGLLRPLLPISSEISAYTPNNALIISSTGGKITEIEKIIQSLDTPTQGTIEIIPLHYANANDIATAVKSMLPPSSNMPGRAPTMIAADSNSNSILISGSPQDRANIKTLIKKMDTLTYDTAKVSSTAVVNLRYLNAKDFAPILQNVAAGVGASAASTSSSGKSGSDTSSAGSNSDSSSGGMLSAIRGLYTTPADTAKSNSASSASSYASSSSSGGTSGVHVQAEPATNSLIIDGSPAQIRSLKAVIAKLDVQPQQVLVEALIAEVDESEMQKLGVQWGTLPPSNTINTSTTAGGVTNLNSGVTTGSLNGSNTVPSFDNNFSTITGGLGVGIVDVGRIKTLVTALRNDAATNILSTPSMVVLDNEEAEIKVGQKVSTSQGSYQNLAAGGGVVSQSQYQDVSLTLKVTPQISENDAIRLKLEHQNDALTSQTGSDGNPTISDSQFKTNVMVNSGQILVIGGLISNDTEESVQKVPFLGSIPLIGRLFQYRSDSLTKKNLLIFLRPIVLHDRTTANQETLKRYSMVRDLQLTHKRDGDILLPKGSNTVLPQWPSAPLPQPFSNSASGA